MTQEEKNLFLRDLSARLSYGVKLDTLEGPQELDTRWLAINMCNIASPYLPYLFPLSSMTEEIMDEIYEVSGVYDICIDSSVHIEVGTTFEDLTKIFHILNKHHIDYNGLIDKGLAIDCTNLNIY